jgi:ribulose kinase
MLPDAIKVSELSYPKLIYLKTSRKNLGTFTEILQTDFIPWKINKDGKDSRSCTVKHFKVYTGRKNMCDYEYLKLT